MWKLIWGLFIGASFWTATAALAQVVREDGVRSLAGTLNTMSDRLDDYQFKSRGNHILFVDLDAELYINKASHHAEDTEPAEAENEESCEGPARFILQVYDEYGNLVCHAGKPPRPGWETDPRMACLLNEEGTYLLRVGLKNEEDSTSGISVEEKIFPYLLSVSLRALATDGSPSNMNNALAESRNKFPGGN
ncbi:hypothetical protein [Malonomonas rubra]|uniref:hypothetical protein n=1 Tax=Malonomonas rubra TaxID=57040 RepID=UPI0026EB8A81|nr:hypothetical protein [Malonomonas rubra]